MDTFDLETRTTLVGMRFVFGWTKDAIFDGVETEVEIRTRVRASSQITAEAEPALRVDVAAKSEIG
jgi:hypothetical protein